MLGRIDAHHHLWRYTPHEYGWIGEEMAALRRNFLLNDLTPLLQSADVDRTMAVQARQTVAETQWLLSLAAGESPIAGVVGWLPLGAPEFPALLDEFLSQPAMKGLRHVAQAEPTGFLDGEMFNAGIARLRGTGLVYDILILPHQLGETIRFVDRHPEQQFVLDHMAKPLIRSGEMEPWASDIRELARREHVSCKVSGMVTEAELAHWTNAQMKPYFDIVLEAFGPERMMVGTDWPVLTVGCEYQQWWQVVEGWIEPLAVTERSAILGGTAERVYRLNESAT